MNPLTLANAIANVVVVVAVTDMAIRVFGNKEHRIHSHPGMLWTRKLVSSIVICGAVSNIATLSTPAPTEVLLNYGFALNYLFSSFYDRFTSAKNSSDATTLPKQRPSRRSGGAGKTSANPPARRTGRKRDAS
jgi:hypothetical protein